MARSGDRKSKGKKTTAAASSKASRSLMSLAKITKPHLANVYHRTRLFKLLDSSRKKHSIIWLKGPPGSGKTTLAASYIEKKNKKKRDVLLKTCFLKRITPEIAQKITGFKDSQNILSDLAKRNYFIVNYNNANGDYEFHPLFREFLLDRAKSTMSLSFLKDIQSTASSLMEEFGYIEDAVDISEALRKLINKPEKRGVDNN